MKYNHQFVLTRDCGPTKIYKSDSNNVRLDFCKDMVRVAIYKDEERIFPTFSVCPGDSLMPRHGRDKLSTEGLSLLVPSYNKDENIDAYSFGDIKITIDLHNFQMSYYFNNKILFKDRDYISYNFENELGKGGTHYITREKDEHIYGLGDKTGNINKNGRHFKLEALDAMGYNSMKSDPLYKQIPFYICKNSVGSYGIYYDTYSNGEIDFGSEIDNYFETYKYFKCEESVLVFYVFFGDINAILRGFSYLCGKNFFPPMWSLKYCGSTMTYTDASNADERLREFVNLCKKYNIDCGGFYLSSGYTQIKDKRYVFNWNKDKIPNPQDLSKFFKDNGIEFIANVKPAFLTDHFLYEKIASKGWFLHYKDGTPAIFPFWGGFGSYLDFTNDEAYEFWTECVKKNLIDYGYKNIWNDNNEYSVLDEDVYANGFSQEIKAKLIRPLFSLLMTMASLEAQDTSVKHMSVTRCGVAGLQRIAETWTGDNNTSFDEFRGNHKIAMTMSLTGLYNFGQDIGGFAGPRPDKELLIRWLQYGVFTPRFCLHSWNPDNIPTMPWLYEDEMDTVTKIFDFRNKLIPYLYNALHESVENYKPIIYPLFLKYPEYDEESDLFFFGDSIVACPIFDKGKSNVKVYLPTNNGGWYYNEKHFENEITVDVPLNDLPCCFIKGGSVIPLQEKELIFHIYPLCEGKLCYNYYYDDGVTLNKGNTIVIEVCCSKDEIIISSNEKINIKVIDYLNRKIDIK